MKVAISRIDLQGDPNRQSLPGVREDFKTIGFVLFQSRLKALSKSRYITALIYHIGISIEAPRSRPFGKMSFSTYKFLLSPTPPLPP